MVSKIEHMFQRHIKEIEDYSCNCDLMLGWSCLFHKIMGDFTSFIKKNYHENGSCKLGILSNNE